MKTALKNIFFLILSFLLMATSISFASTCKSSFQGKPFAQVAIKVKNGLAGRVECDYKKRFQSRLYSYKFPKNEKYYPSSGNWIYGSPGYYWCTQRSGNTWHSCQFKKKD